MLIKSVIIRLIRLIHQSLFVIFFVLFNVQIVAANVHKSSTTPDASFIEWLNISLWVNFRKEMIASQGAGVFSKFIEIITNSCAFFWKAEKPIVCIVWKLFSSVFSFITQIPIFSFKSTICSGNDWYFNFTDKINKSLILYARNW